MIIYLKLGELFAPDVKGLGASLNGTLNWLLGKLHQNLTAFKNLNCNGFQKFKFEL
jgi:hypothetical protein